MYFEAAFPIVELWSRLLFLAIVLLSNVLEQLRLVNDVESPCRLRGQANEPPVTGLYLAALRLWVAGYYWLEHLFQKRAAVLYTH